MRNRGKTVRGVVLGRVYTNRNGHRIMPYHVDVRAGAVNARVQAHDLTTGYDESWSVRLFLADHTAEGAAVGHFEDDGDRDGGPLEDAGERAMSRWAARYDDLNGAPENDEDR